MTARLTELTAEDLRTAIVQRYEPPEWHCEHEVTFAKRRLDVVALNLWGARGYRIVGFEIKVARGDWMRELAAFQKTEDWVSIVDAFYVVTPPKLVRDDELPAGWGLLELTGSRMMTRRHATTRPPQATIPREVAARFVDRIATRARHQQSDADGKDRVRLRAELRKDIDDHHRTELSLARAEGIEIAKAYHELMDALGLRVGAWGSHTQALRAAGAFAAANGDDDAIREQLRVLREKLVLRKNAIDIALERPNGGSAAPTGERYE